MKRMLFCLLGLLLLLGPVARDGSQARGAVPALTEELTLPGAERGEETTRAVPAVKAEDLSEKYLRSEGENAVLVIYCACTDGPELDRQAFEELFCADLDRADELRSVSAYYHYNSCGKVSLDFSFVYLDSGVSSAELYRQTEKDPWGLFQKLFRQAREAYEGDWRELDRDGDGYVDLVVMLSGEDIYKTRNDGQGYYAFGGGSMATLQETPDPERPVMCQIIHMSAKTLLNPLAPCRQASGPRVLIHEIGHAFGLIDYYDFYEDENGQTIDALGMFDMQSYDFGDWNPFSRFLCGWVEPWLIPEGTEQITLEISPDQPLLIPGSDGWNGTPFDEYILIDVAAPQGANAYDWDWMLDERLVRPDSSKRQGGVRVYHVDGRLLRADLRGAEARYTPAFTLEEIRETLLDPDARLDFAYYNSNGVKALLEGDSPYFHLIDLIPADGSSKFRLPHPLSFAIYTPVTVEDFFGPGEEFSMERCGEAFPNAPFLNRGDSLAYRVLVESYDPESRTAVVTVSRVN